MDDMGTPGPNHPAWRGLGKRSQGQFDNVLDFGAARISKMITGRAKAVRVKASPSMMKHEDEALGIHKD